MAHGDSREGYIARYHGRSAGAVRISPSSGGRRRTRQVALASLLIIATGCAHVQSLLSSRDDPPSSFVHSTAEARTTRVLDVREGLSRGALFRAAAEVLGDRWTVDVTDARAGFLMTTWQASFARSGIPDLRYRTRIVVRFLPPEWKRLSVTAEANWQHGDEWEVGYDKPLLDQVTTELEGALGRKP